MAFTTPLLAGARVRQSKGSAPELVVPSPSGGRGVYIVHWAAVRALCNPTVHDTVLFQRIGQLVRLDPASIRDAVLEVAQEGYAGTEAAAAAERAMDADRSQNLLAHFLLMMELIEQIEPSGCKPTLLTERTPDLDRRATDVLNRIAPSLGHPAAHLANRLAAIGHAFAPVGIARGDVTARIPKLIQRLKSTYAGLAKWLAADGDNDVGGLGKSVTGKLKIAVDGAQMMLEATRSSLSDPLSLLKRWAAAPEGALATVMRCDWMLDGWEHISLLWMMAQSSADRRAAFLEMAQLLPVIPREVSEWIDLPIPREAMDPVCRVISYNDAWRRGGAAVTLIHRNEALHAMIE